MMLFRRREGATFEFSLDIEGGSPRLMVVGDKGWFSRTWLSRAEAIAAAKLLINAAEKMPERERVEGTLYCSFCGKSQHEVRKLIAGPTAFVCNECADLCTEIVAEDKGGAR